MSIIAAILRAQVEPIEYSKKCFQYIAINQAGNLVKDEDEVTDN